MSAMRFQKHSSVERDGAFLATIENESDNEHALVGAILESTEHMVLALDAKGQVIIFNGALSKYVRDQYGVEVISGMTAGDFLPMARADAWQGMLKEVVKRGSLSTEYTKPGAKSLALSFQPIMVNGKLTGGDVWSGCN
jgi:transcriptional regulator with PAS, ATPase and Fis domain